MFKDAYTEAASLLQSGRRQDARKRLEALPGLSRGDVGNVLKKMETENRGTLPQAYQPSSGEHILRESVSAMVHAGQVMRAIDFIRENRIISLADTFALIDELYQKPEHRTPRRPMPMERDRMWAYILGGLIFLGVIFLVIATAMFYKQYTFIAESDRSTGRVVDMIVNLREPGTAPVVAYEWKGQAMTHTGAFSRGLFKIKLGDEVPIYIHRISGEILIDTFGDRWFTPSIFSFLALGFIIMPLWVGYKLRG